MMSSTFLTLILMLSVVVSFVVEALKNIFTQLIKKFSINLIVLIVSLIVGWVGGYFSYILLAIPFNPVTIVLLILLGPTLFFTSTVGYDKVEQTVKQVTQIGGSI